jgi:hypothetical protein
MLARCAHCQQTFSTDHFGVQRCPHCGWEVLLADPDAPEGPDAGGDAAPPPAPPPSPPPPGWASAPEGLGGTPAPWGPMAPGTALPPPGPDDGESAPFVRRRRLGFLASFGHTWRLAAFEPRRFFRFVRASDTGSALLFGVISFTLGTWMSLLYAALAGGAGSSALQELLRRLPPGSVDAEATIAMMERATLRGVVGQGLVAPVIGLVGIYVAAGIMHLLLLALRAAPRGFSATLTVVSYAYGMFLLEALPMCGGVVALGWFVVIAVIGLSEAQRCGTGRAGFAVLAPALLLCACLCASAGLMAARLGGGSLPSIPEGTDL